jgi:hypothetical protein
LRRVFSLGHPCRASAGRAKARRQGQLYLVAKPLISIEKTAKTSPETADSGRINLFSHLTF